MYSLPTRQRRSGTLSSGGLARAAALAAVIASPCVGAAELLVVEQDDCPYCERFDAEIAPIWPKTAQGRRAPLRRVPLSGPWPAALATIERATFTPTFILVEDGREIDRLVGYPGEEHFWFLVGELLGRIAPRPEATDSSASDAGTEADRARGAAAVVGTSIVRGD